MNREIITDILVERAETLRGRNSLDMSMFPEAEVSGIYAAAGRRDQAKRMGLLALKSNRIWDRKYGAKIIFEAAGNQEDLAVVQFIEKNFREY